jgi:glutamine amidotransferase
MQWLFAGSDEAPSLTGLGIFCGNCVHLQKLRTQELKMGPTPVDKVPHVGWNSLEVMGNGGLLHGVRQGEQVYFTHSYAAPIVAETAAATTYVGRFSAAVERGRVAGVQFHPEKSGDVGLRILRNWIETVAARP